MGSPTTLVAEPLSSVSHGGPLHEGFLLDSVRKTV
jgi:hypothetical protein